MSTPDWRPGASLETLRARAALLADIRQFFAQRGVLEVDTPLASVHGTTDPAIDSFTTRYRGPGAPEGRTLYLHTSPEFAMKRLLAAGSGSIYQICKVFRDGESGRRHNPEFTMLEWYRVGFDHHQLMDEAEELINAVLSLDPPAERLTYAETFKRYADIDPHKTDMGALCNRAQQAGIDGLELDNHDAWLDLLMTHVIETQLPRDRMTFIYDYPASQAALARVRDGNPPVAERFEVYCGDMELANGFHELADGTQQRARFEKDNATRAAQGKPQVPMDENMLAALEHGMPACAGVALGVDRLLMLRVGAEHIDEVATFNLSRS